eukprot:8854680-Pyramimonas_sp.AAC.1
MRQRRGGLLRGRPGGGSSEAPRGLQKAPSWEPSGPPGERGPAVPPFLLGCHDRFAEQEKVTTAEI